MVIDRKNVITDTKAILKYLGEKHTENDLLYPTNRRDEIDISVCFAVDTLRDLVANIYVSQSKSNWNINNKIWFYIFSTSTYSIGYLKTQQKSKNWMKLYQKLKDFLVKMSSFVEIILPSPIFVSLSSLAPLKWSIMTCPTFQKQNHIWTDVMNWFEDGKRLVSFVLLGMDNGTELQLKQLKVEVCWSSLWSLKLLKRIYSFHIYSGCP